MGRLLASIFGLRKEERGMAFLMALYHFLLLITLYLLKPVRDSLFLSDRGPEELPFVFILTTFAVAPVAFLHGRAAKRLHVGRLIDGVSGALLACLVGLYWMLSLEAAWSPYVLYAWVSIYGLLVTSQFWLLANAIFDASQAKRVFTVLSVGAILGAVVGGEVTGLLVDELGLDSTTLLWVTAGLLGLSMGLARWIRYRHAQSGGQVGDGGGEANAAEEATGALQVIRDSMHVRNIVGIIALTVITSAFVDFQFKTVAAQAFTSESSLTTFMGRFYGRVSLIALLIQFVVAPRLMRVVGIGGALALLPAFLALGATAMIALPGLVAGILLRGSEQSLKHSVDRTGRELLFVPVPLEAKKRVKVFVDLFVDQGAQGIGGALLLLLTVGFGLGVQALSVVTLGLLAVWGVMVYRARQSYVDQFRHKLREQENYDDEDDHEDGGDDADLDAILQSLCSHNETDALRALEELAESDLTVPVDVMLCLFDHPAAAVREETLRVLRVRHVRGVGTEVAEMLTDPDPDVQLSAAQYLYCNHSGNRLKRLHEALNHDDLRIQGAAVGLIAEEGGPDEYELVDEAVIRRLMQAEGDIGEDARTHLARLFGVVDRPYRHEMLQRLLNDESPQVVRAAVEAAGRTEERAFVYPLLVRLAEDAYEREAKEALAQYGVRITGTLYDHLVDERVNRQVRHRIPAVLVQEACQVTATVLIRSLERLAFDLRLPAVRALSRLHAKGDFDFDSDVIEAAIQEDARHYAALGQILNLRLRTQPRTGATVEPAVVRAYRDESLERIFRLLGLRYNQRDIYDAYLGITSTDESLRASAVEFVDNLVEYSTSRYLLPLLDDPNGEQVRASSPFETTIRTWEQAETYLTSAQDPRLARVLDEKDAVEDAVVSPDGRQNGRGDGAGPVGKSGAVDGSAAEDDAAASEREAASTS